MRAKLRCTPEPYDPRYYEGEYPEYDDEIRYSIYQEDQSEYIRDAFDRAEELLSGYDLIFHDVSVSYDQMRYETAVEVDIDSPDNVGDLAWKWEINTSYRDTPNERRLYTLFRREESQLERYVDDLRDIGFEVYTLAAVGDNGLALWESENSFPGADYAGALGTSGFTRVSQSRRGGSMRNKSKPSPRCLVNPIDSKASKLVQAADLSTRSLGHALLPSGKGSSRYFDEIRNRTINVHGKPGASTQQTPTGFNRDGIVPEGKDLNIVNSRNADKTSANGHRSGRRGTANEPSKKSKSGSSSKSRSVRTKTKTKQTKGVR